MPRFASAQEVLEQVFGHTHFRSNQLDIIQSILSGQDTLAIMPTGGGKSLCYQIPALLRPGVAIVISPLIALMQNQVEALRQKGIHAAFLNSTLTEQEAIAIYRGIHAGYYDFLYLSPERLVRESTLRLIDSLQVSLFAIDEAHCICTWGHDFRPDYQGLSVLKERYPQVPRIALTATADPQSRQEIKQKLLQAPQEFLSSFDRPNLFLAVEEKQKLRAKEQLLDFIQSKHPKDAGIVYCLTRKTTEDIASYLNHHRIQAYPYHAGMSIQERSEVLQKFLNDNVVVVATIAFGMGIDKANVRFVAHYDLPKSIEGYFQEIGRAGRDGLPADVFMLYGFGDVKRHEWMIQNSEGTPSYKLLQQEKLDAIFGYAESASCRRAALLAYFGEKIGECGHCDNCRRRQKSVDVTIAAQKFLSCVVRAQQKSARSFTVAHMINVLLGIEDEVVKAFEHQSLSTFGIGRELTVKQWEALVRQLLSKDIIWLETSTNEACVRLTKSKARAVLSEGEKVFLHPKFFFESTQTTRTRRQSTTAIQNERLEEVLQRWVRSKARARDIPPDTLMNKKQLTQLAQKQPTSRLGLAQIIGKGFLYETYAEDLLILLRREKRSGHNAS